MAIRHQQDGSDHMTQLLNVTVTAPQGVVWEGQASYVRIPGVLGDFGVLPRHQPIVSLLRMGAATITVTDGTKLTVAVHGGFAFVHDRTVTLLIDNHTDALPMG